MDKTHFAAEPEKRVSKFGHRSQKYLPTIAPSAQIRAEAIRNNPMKSSRSIGIPLALGFGVLVLYLSFVVPAQAAWITSGPMALKRYIHTATLLPNGKVLLTGGTDDTSITNRAEIYDPVTGTCTPTGSMNVPRMAHTATLLPNGKVLVVGG